ncbi:MAG: HAMP domain-containing histidine kinase [Caldilineaceae bacterium]|nr:HAMP domain-containing histidine kinase [Caldilineaceae bacterium]
MLDKLVAELILQERQIAYALTDQAFIIQEIGGKRELLMSDQQPVGVGASLFTLAPELIGYEDQLQALLAGALPSFQLELVNREDHTGQLFYVTLHNYAYVSTAQRPGILHILEDVTLIGEVHQRLTQQRNELSLLNEQVNRFNLQLEAANTELRALDELKSKFVSIAAHELRTPLASILGYVDFILEDPITPLPAEHVSSVNVIGKSARRLLALTNNLLDVTRIEAGHIELTLESIDLAQIVEEVAIYFYPEMEQKRQYFSIDKQPQLPNALCDEARTSQIFSNLLSNAIKYTPEEGQISIKLHYSEQEDLLLAAVADSGIGIPAKDLPNVGKNFYRASNVHLSKATGAGLGLSITRSLVELQGGRLWVDSKPGVGSTFYLTFPIDDGVFSPNKSIVSFPPLR